MIDYSNPKTILTLAWDGTLPVNPIQIATDLGILVRPNNDYVCKSFKDNGRQIIEYDTSSSNNLQRFAIAHSLAHHLLGHTKNIMIDDIENFNMKYITQEEYDANNFALKLLMPTVIVNYLITKRKMTSLSELATIFEVSTVAMECRLRQLNFI